MSDNLSDIIRAQQGDNYAEQVAVKNNLALVHSICKRFTNRGVDYEDLFQLGSMGLLKAIRRFDPSYEVCFSTYAVPLIAGEIKRFLRDDGLMKCSRSTKTLAQQIYRINHQKPDITVDELATELKVDPEDIALALSTCTPILSLDATVGDDDVTLLEFFGTASFENEAQNRLYTEQLLDSLEPREKELLIMRYFECKTQTEVAKKLDMSQVQVSRLERKILSLLRARAG